VADSTESRRSRRALLGAVAGAAAATVVGAVTRPLPTEASTDHANYLNNETNANVLVARSLHQSGYPDSGKGTAVEAQSSTGTAVHASNSSWPGSAVLAESGEGFAVYATNNSSNQSTICARNYHANGTAITAYGQPGDGILGESAGGGTGVKGVSLGGTGVHGESDENGYGVYALSLGGVGLHSEGPSDGVQGSCGNADHSGVWGDNTGGGWGVVGSTSSPSGSRVAAKVGVAGINRGGGTGVLGYCGPATPFQPRNVGVYGVAPTGRGGVFSGATAQLKLVPSTAATHPTYGALGDLFLDTNTRLWFCKGGSTWVQLA
jgi:hypothetical protein